MKAVNNTLIIIAFAFLIVACKNEKQPEIKTVETNGITTEINPNATYAKAEFGIEGMTCEIGCARTIQKKIAQMDGVKSVKVDFGKKMAMVEYDEAKVTTTSLEETVTKVADVYSVKNMKTVDEFSKYK